MERGSVLDAVNGRDARARFDHIAGHLNAQHGHLIDAAVWTLTNEIHWQGEGLTSPARFLAWRFAIHHTTATKALTIAARADELPECVQAVRDGLLSFDQMTVIARHAPGWADRQVLNLCERLTVDQIQRLLPRYPWPPDPDALPEPEPTESSSGETDTGRTDTDDAINPMDNHAHGNDSGSPTDTPSAGDNTDSPGGCCQPAPSPDEIVSYGRTPTGRWYLYAEIEMDAGTIIQHAIEEARDRRFRVGDTDTDLVDALLDIAERSLDAVTSTERRNRFRTNIHLNTDGTTTDAIGRLLPPSVAQHITCDGLISPVFLADGIPVSVGRSQHIVPDRTRRIVLLRDGGCTVPGCNHRGHLEVHHITHWSKGGPTDTWNLLCLCPKHHRMHHRGKLDITGDADAGTVVFTNQRGRVITNSGAQPEPPGAPPPQTAGRYRPPCGERLDHNYVSFPHPNTLSLPIRRNTRL